MPNRDSLGKLRHRRGLTFIAAAVAVCVCVAAAPAARAAPAAPVTRAAPIAQAGPAGQAPVAAQHAKTVKLMIPNACTQACPVYEICLLNSNTHCAAFDPYVDTAAIIDSIVGLIYIFKVIKGVLGHSSDEVEGNGSGGGEPTDFRCLAAADNSSGTTPNVYLTGNCGNPEASWVCVANGSGCNYYSVWSLNMGEHRMLTVANTNNGSQLYVKRATSGTWQTWGWYHWGTCTTGCSRHGQRGSGHAIRRLVPGPGGFGHSPTKPSTLWPGG